MAKAIITITDTEDGQIGIRIEFDPPADGDAPGTNAQLAALLMISQFTEEQGAK